MKKLFLLITFLSVFFITFSSVNSQIIQYTSSKFKPPIVSIDLLFNYSQPLPNLYGEIKDFFSFENYGVKLGFGSQVHVKITANKKGTIKPYFNIGYNLFLGSDNSSVYFKNNAINSFPGSKTIDYNLEKIPGTSKLFLHDFYAGAGFCYDFVNKKNQWVPFLLVQLDFNVLFGTYRQQPYSSPSGYNAEVSYTIKQAARLGFGLGGGVQLRLSKYLGLTWSAKYKFSNLIGKSSESITESNKIHFLDLKDTDIHINLKESRQVNYIEFGLGVAFYIGKK